MKVMTCNIRCSTAGDGENAWPLRRDLCCRVIRSRSPDLICFQEVREDQFAAFTSAFPEFDAYGVADVPLGRDPVNAIFFRRDVFRFVWADTFWLSETPHVPGSRSWESANIRLAGWVHLSERSSSREFVVINTHLDHMSGEARRHQAGLINAWAAAFPSDCLVILTGDMNCDQRSEAIASYKAAGWRDTWEAVHGPGEPGNTVHWFLGPDHMRRTQSFDWWPDDQGKVDWIFVRGDVKVTDAGIVRDHEDGRYPSDHYFVAAELDW